MSRTDLGQPDWLVSDATRQVLAALEAVRQGGSRFVGGCVRNTLMGRPVDDIDIATQLLPRQVIEALQAAGIRSVPTGIEHGTVTAICQGEPYEITTLRRDVETDGRRAVVAFSEDWAEDAARRDFRMNALYADGEGNVFDPVGGGIEDAAEGRVIFIGDADERLKEDYLRILRFFRFNAWYGAGIDEEGLKACERQKGGLKQIAAERIWKELEKLLRAPDPVLAVEAMAQSGVLAEILPDASTTHFREYMAMAGSKPDSLQRLMVMLPRELMAVNRVADGLRLSNAERGRLMAWAGDEIALAPEMSPQQARAAAYKLGKRAFEDRLATAIARDGETAWSNVLAAVETLKQLPVFPLRGQDIVDQGLSGPAVGEAMRALEDWWIEQDFRPDRDELLARVSLPPR